MTEKHVQDPVFRCRPQRDRQGTKRLAEAKRAILVTDEPLRLDFANNVLGAILDWGQHVRVRARTGLVPARRDGHLQGLVWALQIVDIPPPMQVCLAVRHVAKDLVAQDFGDQGAVKAFILALSLRMIGARVAHLDAQADQPRRQRRVGMRLIRAPRRTWSLRPPQAGWASRTANTACSIRAGVWPGE